MAAEIERKFLVSGDAWRGAVERSMPLRQGYLASGRNASVRVRVAGAEAWLNIKSMTLGIERQEFEYPVPVADGETMLDELAEGALIEKTRHFVPFAGKTWEIDEFYGANAGLIVAELELDSADDVVEFPDWVAEEVSDDPRYYNVRLVTHPFRDWA